MDPLAPKVQVELFGITDVGRRRKGNEDNFLIADLQTERRIEHKTLDGWRIGGRGALFAVCDGMGGAAAGEVASQMAVDILFERMLQLEPALPPQEFASLLDHTVQRANHEIHSLAKKDSSKKGMGTTVSAAAVYGNVLFLAQIGDSRAYLYRNGKFAQVTKDQSLLERLLEEGAISPEHAENFSGKNVILQALGPAPQVLVDLKFLELQQDDLILLCSDGLHGEVKDDELLEIVSSNSDLPTIGQELIDRANKNGGSDNITAVVVRMSGNDLQSASAQQEAVPRPVKYVRMPIDSITARMEKELGLTHWLNKYLFAMPMLIIYAVLLLGSIGYFGSELWSNWKSLETKSPKKSSTVENGRLVVTSDVKNAMLFIDDTEVGTLQNGGISLTLPLGGYKVFLMRGDWKSPEKRVKLSSNKPKLVELLKSTKKPQKKQLLTRKEWLPGRDP